MTAVTYTARRSIIPGHFANNTYSLDLHVVDMPIERLPSLNQQQSLDGNRETIRWHAVELYTVTLAFHSAEQIMHIREFLDSVEAFEAFQFDPYGSSNVPVAPIAATLETSGYQLTRQLKGQGGANDDYRTSFRVRVLHP